MAVLTKWAKNVTFKAKSMENLPEEPQKTASEIKKPEINQKVVGAMMFEAGIEFALLIAAPLIGFILLGRWLDSKWHTHFLIIIGILFALLISCVAIYKRINAYKKMLGIK